MIRALCLTMLWFFGADAYSAGPIPNAPFQQDTSDMRYANDLDSADINVRLFAARVLLRRAKEAWRVGGRQNESLRVIEARQRLANFDEIVAPRCTRLIDIRNIQHPCVKILGLLESRNSLQRLKSIDTTKLNRCRKSAVQQAIRRIERNQ